MARSPFKFWEFQEKFLQLVGPALLCVMLLVLSTISFAFNYRQDLIIFAAGQDAEGGVRLLITMGATAHAATDTFPEPALITYLHKVASDESGKVRTPELTRLLLGAGASVTERSEGGWPPLMIAASAGQLPIVETLVGYGAEIDARALGPEKNDGMTALMAASVHGQANVVRFLLRKGADLHLRSVTGFTPLLLAASGGHLGCVEALLEKGASVSLSTIQVAERNGHEEVAQRLLSSLQQRRDTINRLPAQYPEE